MKKLSRCAGAALIWWVLDGELTRRGVRRYRFLDASGSSRTLAEAPAVLLEWLAVHYGTQVGLPLLQIPPEQRLSYAVTPELRHR